MFAILDVKGVWLIFLRKARKVPFQQTAGSYCLVFSVIINFNHDLGREGKIWYNKKIRAHRAHPRRLSVKQKGEKGTFKGIIIYYAAETGTRKLRRKEETSLR